MLIHAVLVPALLLVHAVQCGSYDCYDELRTPSDKLVIVHLFEWKWKDIATECENYLQYTGIGAVQVSPPNEHIVYEHNGDHPWWLRYQPVSYKLESRSGNRQQFADMVKRCHKVGIGIIVDSVINHMVHANAHGYGSGGSFYNSTPLAESFPAVPYTSEDFNDDICNDNILNYNDEWQVRNCRLSSLLDLKMSSSKVQEKIANYLNDLIDLGVAGFRFDAAKHMYPEHLKQILSRVKTLNPEFYPKEKCPFIFHEVIDQGPEAIRGAEYTSFGRITNFRYGLDLSAAVNRQKNFKHFDNFGEDWAYWPSHDVLVFVDNHDNQRGSGGGGFVLTYKDGDQYVMAVSFMLAWPYGIPRVMSSYYFEGHDMGPPSSGKPDFITASPKFTASGLCDESSGWVCEHRWPAIRRMTLFRKAVQNYSVSNVVTEDNRIAFSRGDKGFFALNNDPKYAWIRSLQTSLQPGVYCDMVSGEIENNTCTGQMIIVNDNKVVDIAVRPGTVIALGEISKHSVPSGYKRTVVFVKKETNVGDSLFLRGGISEKKYSNCKTRKGGNECSIPILHMEVVNPFSPDLTEWKKNDKFLDWYGKEENQGIFQSNKAKGSPLQWTTNNVHNPLYNPLNKYGDHYWMLDVLMDCSKTDNEWFEFDAFINDEGEGRKDQNSCEGNGNIIAVPYNSTHHMGRCGYINVYDFNESSCKSLKF